MIYFLSTQINILKDTISRKLAMNMPMLQEKLDNIRGAVMMGKISLIIINLYCLLIGSKG
jgi:hypothetical protein